VVTTLTPASASTAASSVRVELTVTVSKATAPPLSCATADTGSSVPSATPAKNAATRPLFPLIPCPQIPVVGQGMACWAAEGESGLACLRLKSPGAAAGGHEIPPAPNGHCLGN